MAQYYVQQFVLVLLLILISGEMMNNTVMGQQYCSIRIGDCGNDCSQRCKNIRSEFDGQCDYNVKPPICTCFFSCTPPAPPSPPSTPLPPSPPGKCNDNDGTCSQECDDGCCAGRCKSKYVGKVDVSGSCQDVGGTAARLCLCEFDC